MDQPNDGLTEFKSLSNKDLMRCRIAELSQEHRDLDSAIAFLVMHPSPDELQLRRLKKRKLRIKDMLAKLQMLLIPDEPA